MSSLSLAYVGLGVADPAGWARFAVNVLGMAEAQPRPLGDCLLQVDERAWRIALHESPADDLIYAGYEVSDIAALDRVRDAFAEVGVRTRDMTAAELDERQTEAGLQLTDPDGLAVEIVVGLATSPTPFQSPREVAFVTGDMGLGHMVVAIGDMDRTLAFYGALGFKVSDYIETKLGPGPKLTLAFLHCNPRHHTLGLLPVPTPKRLNHLMFEVSSVDEVIAAYYRAQESGAKIVRHLGRHTNDQMLSFYASTPAGFDVEYGCDGLRVGPDWKVQTFDLISIWGHEA